MNLIRKSISFLGVCFFVLMVIVFIWDALGPRQKWLHYSKGDEPIEHGLYTSLADCEVAMNEMKSPSGCMRVDGPFRILAIVGAAILW